MQNNHLLTKKQKSGDLNVLYTSIIVSMHYNKCCLGQSMGQSKIWSSTTGFCPEASVQVLVNYQSDKLNNGSGMTTMSSI